MDDSAEMWCWMSRVDADDFLTSSNLSWPFSNVSMDDFYALAEPKTNRIYQIEDALWYVAMAILPSGVFLNTLLLCTVWKKVFKEKNAFFASMFIITVFDLLYNIMSIIYQMWYTTFILQGSKNFIAIWLLAYVSGIAFTTRIAGDLVALALTVERYISVVKPQLYNNLSSGTKKTSRLVVLCAVVLVSSSKMHYTFSIDVSLAGDTYHYITSNASAFWSAVRTFSDMILPFVLLIVTPVVSAGFRAAARRHYGKYSTKVQQAPATQSVMYHVSAVTNVATENGTVGKRVKPKVDSKNKEWICMLTLTLILDVMLMLTQLANCLFCMAEWVCNTYEVSYDSGYEKIWWWWFGKGAEGFLDIPLTIIETSTHSFNFLIYIALSNAMRTEFVQFMKRIKK